MALDSASLNKAFNDAGIDLGADSVGDMLQIGKEYSLTAMALAENYEAFLMTVKGKKNAQKTAMIEQFRSYVKKNAPRPEVYGGYGDGYRFTSTLELAEDDGSPPVFTRTPAPAPTRQSVGTRAEVFVASPIEPAPVAAAIELLPQVRRETERMNLSRPDRLSHMCSRAPLLWFEQKSLHKSERVPATQIPFPLMISQLQTPAGGTPFSRRPAKLVSSAALNGHLEALAPVADKMARGERAKSLRRHASRVPTPSDTRQLTPAPTLRPRRPTGRRRRVH